MDVWNRLMGMSGEHCYTITQKRPATMNVDTEKVTINYSSGRSLVIRREMVEAAYNRLVHQGKLTIDDAFDITQNKDRTDRIMAVLSRLDDVTSSSNPRELYHRGR